jgi:hypothetical protein
MKQASGRRTTLLRCVFLSPFNETPLGHVYPGDSMLDDPLHRRDTLGLKSDQDLHKYLVDVDQLVHFSEFEGTSIPSTAVAAYVSAASSNCLGAPNACV